MHHDLERILERAREGMPDLRKLPPPPSLSLTPYLRGAPLQPDGPGVGIIAIELWDAHRPALVDTPAGPQPLPCITGGSGHPADMHHDGCYWGPRGIPLGPFRCLPYEFPGPGVLCLCHHLRVYRSWIRSEQGMFDSLSDVVRGVPGHGPSDLEGRGCPRDGAGVGVMVHLLNTYPLTAGGACTTQVGGGMTPGHGDPNACSTHIYAFSKCYPYYETGQIKYSCQHANTFRSDSTSKGERDAVKEIVDRITAAPSRNGHVHNGVGSPAGTRGRRAASPRKAGTTRDARRASTEKSRR